MQIDTPINLYEKPRNRFVAGFIGNPAMNFVNGEVGGGARDAGSGMRDAGSSANAARFVAEGGDWELQLPSRVAASLASARGKGITLGIRPEDVSVAAGTGVGAAATTARLDLVESLGNETFIYARTGRHDITARVSPAESLPPIGGSIVLAFNLERAHFFDTVSGDRIG
jgi:multiple sugar transport system ATP-binding protein